MKFNCRHCNNILSKELIDLGVHPASNNYLSCDELNKKEKKYPLSVYICEKCWLVQIPEHAKPKELFSKNYAYFSSTSTSWCEHAKRFVDKCISEKIIHQKSFVVEIASNDGYLLQYVKKAGINCLGIEPTESTAKASDLKGIDTIREFFGKEFSEILKIKYFNKKELPDLIIANNVIAHVPDINDFMKGLENLISDSGYISVEFPHLLNLISKSQFDTIYHEHFSYLSLRTIKRIADSVGLVIVNTEELITHGGSLRVWLQKKRNRINPSLKINIDLILEKERKYQLENIITYESFKNNVYSMKKNILEFLYNCKLSKKIIGGYGAAAKANTLLNFINVNHKMINFVADKSESKQNKFLPGSHIPIIAPEQIDNYKPDILIIFPWNIAQEIKKDLKIYQLYVLIPEVKKIN